MNSIEDVLNQIYKDCSKILHRYFVSVEEKDLENISSNLVLKTMAMDDINHVLFSHAQNKLERLFKEGGVTIEQYKD